MRKLVYLEPLMYLKPLMYFELDMPSSCISSRPYPLRIMQFAKHTKYAHTEYAHTEYAKLTYFEPPTGGESVIARG